MLAVGRRRRPGTGAATVLELDLALAHQRDPGTDRRGHRSGQRGDDSESQDNGTRPALWDCNGGTNQAWTSTARSQLTVFDSKCLEAAGGGTADGTAVQIYDCTGSGKCLDATGRGTANGTLLVLWTCAGTPNQN